MLQDKDLIIRPTEERFHSVEDLLDKLEFLTYQLEVYQLRKKFKPSIKEYLKDRPIPPKDGIDPEKFQIKSLQNEDEMKFEELQAKWRRVEKQIMIMMPIIKKKIDLYLNVLIRGRHLFLGSKKDLNYPLYGLVSQIKSKLPANDMEQKVINSLEEITSSIIIMDEFKVGSVKSTLYNLFYVEKNSPGCSLNEEFNRFIVRKNKELLMSISGKSEEDFKKGSFANMIEFRLGKIQQLTLLFDKYIFKKQIWYSLPN